MIKLGTILFRSGMVVVVGVIIGVFSHWRYTAGKETSNAVWQRRWDQRNIADAQLLLQRQQEARAEEQRRIKAITQVNDDANNQLLTARADAARAKSIIISLRDRIRHMQQELTAGDAARVSTTVATRQAGADSHLLLADMFAESLKRNQQLAAYADSARIRGQACERAYEAMINSNTSAPHPLSGHITPQ